MTTPASPERPSVDPAPRGKGRRPMTPQRRNAFVAGASLILLALLLIPRLLGLGRSEGPERLPTPVRVESAGLDRLERVFSFSGHLKPEATTTVVPKVAGRVLEIRVTEGQIVGPDQILLSIEDDVARLQVEQAEAALRAVEAQYQKANTAVRPEELASAKASLRQAEEDLVVAQNQLERSRALFQAGAIPRASFEDAENQVRNAQTSIDNARRQVRLMEEGARAEDITMARSQLDAQRSQLALARLQRDFATVRAPLGGQVVKVHTEAGQTVGPGSPLVTIVSTDRIFALVNAPEVLYGELYGNADDLAIEVFPIAYPGHPGFPALITRVAGLIDAASRSFEVEMAVENRTGLLKPGMFVRVEARRRAPDSRVILPARAVVFRNGAPAVYLADAPTGDGDSWTAREVPVVPGASAGALVEILEGIQPGDRVIVEGNTFLEDLQAIRILEAAP